MNEQREKFLEYMRQIKYAVEREDQTFHPNIITKRSSIDKKCSETMMSTKMPSRLDGTQYVSPNSVKRNNI